MKKLSSFLIVALALMPLLSKAQSTTTNGPKLELDETALTYILDDNDDILRIFSMERGFFYEDIVISKYNKRTHVVTEQVVDEDFEGRFVFLTNDNTTVNLVRCILNKKTHKLEFQKASFPVDVKVPKKLVFTTMCYFPAEKIKEKYQTFGAFNADRSKFAVVTMPYPDRDQPRKPVYVAVFDDTGELLFGESKVVECYPFFHMDNINVAMDGTVYVTKYGSEYDNSSFMHILTCSEHGIFNYSETFENDEHFTCKQMVKPNGDLCVVGIKGKKGDSECKLMTYTATPDGNVDFVDQDITLSDDFEGKKYDDGNLAEDKQPLIPHLFDLIQLSNGDFLLVGEMRKRMQIGSFTKTASNGVTWEYPRFGFLSHNMYYLKVGIDGSLREMNVYQRATVSSEDGGRWLDSNPVYAFEYDGDAYLIYNDNRANYKREGMQSLLCNRPDQCSVILSKIEGNGELSSTIIYDAKTKFKDPQMISQQWNHEYFLKPLHQTDDGIYYILKHDGEYRLEKITFE